MFRQFWIHNKNLAALHTCSFEPKMQIHNVFKLYLTQNLKYNQAFRVPTNGGQHAATRIASLQPGLRRLNAGEADSLQYER
jgi:hypothetical protein